MMHSLVWFFLTLMLCEYGASFRTHGYGKNFKYRKKFVDNQILSYEYPAYKQFDRKYQICLVCYPIYCHIIHQKLP